MIHKKLLSISWIKNVPKEAAYTSITTKYSIVTVKHGHLSITNITLYRRKEFVSVSASEN